LPTFETVSCALNPSAEAGELLALTPPPISPEADKAYSQSNPFVLVCFEKFFKTTKSFVLSLRNPGAILNVLVSF
jgi:hypothetical protein